jgi:pimeloyl-ACP methyl ester carboxylesterase
LLQPTSHFIDLPQEAQCHLRHFPAAGSPVLLVHGAIENGRIFYSQNGKGLAPFLQSLGLDCYVLDLRGRGLSHPPVSRGAEYGQFEAITEELPAAARFIAARRPGRAQIWISHSWGGVLQASTLVRCPELRDKVAGLVLLGVKRSITVRSWARLWRVELGWKRLLPWVAACFGYLPAKGLGLGADSETRSSLAASIAWVGSGAWVDPQDGFDYGEAARQNGLPPSLWVTGSADLLLGAAQDVQRFMAECGVSEDSFIEMGRAQGFLHDYGHIDLITHEDAPKDLFLSLKRWLDDLPGLGYE